MYHAALILCGYVLIILNSDAAVNHHVDISKKTNYTNVSHDTSTEFG